MVELYKTIMPKRNPSNDKNFLKVNEVVKVMRDGGVKKVYAVFAETNIGRVTFGTLIGKASLREGMRKELYADEERFKDGMIKSLEKEEVSEQQSKKDLTYMG